MFPFGGPFPFGFCVALPFGRSWRAMSLGVPAFAVPPRSAWEIWHRKLLVATLAPLLDGYLGESSMIHLKGKMICVICVGCVERPIGGA